MQKKILLLLTIFVMCRFVLFSQTNSIKKNITTNYFNSLSISGNFEVSITNGSSPTLILEGLPDQLNNLILDYENNTLIIKHKKNKNQSPKIKVFITKDTLDNVSANFNTQLNMNGDFYTLSNSFSFSVLGENPSIDFNGNIQAEKINLSINGNGKIETDFKRSYNNLTASVLDNGNILCKNIIASKANLSINGKGKIQILGNSFFEKLDASILNNAKRAKNNECSITFKTNLNDRICDNANLNINGMGDLDFVDLKTKETVISILGIGNVSVFAINKIKGSINGIGNIKYKGQPKINFSCLDIGSIESIE